MKNILKGLGLVLFALLLVVGMGAGSASAVTLTLGAGTAVSSGALTLTGVGTGTTSATAGIGLTANTTSTIVLGGPAQAGAIDIGDPASSAITTVNIATGTLANVINIGEKTAGLSYTRIKGRAQIDGRVDGGAGTTNAWGLQIRTETALTTGIHWGLDNESHVVASGGVSVRGVQGVAVLDTGKTLTGGTLIGTYGQARADGTVAGGSSMAGLYGLIEEGGGAITASHVASLWADSHRNTAVTGEHELIYMSNNGTATMDSAMYVYAGDKITNLLKISTATGMVSDTVASGTAKKIKIDIDGTTYYINVYQ